MRTGGILLILLGTLETTGIWGHLVADIQGTIANWQPPI